MDGFRDKKMRHKTNLLIGYSLNHILTDSYPSHYHKFFISV
jgi:hypothetical protein